MCFELIVLKKEWFLYHESSSDSLKYLTGLMNKGYDKARIKYGVIKSYRVKNTGSFLDDFQIRDTEDFALLLLLGPEEIFRDLKDKDNFSRDFLRTSQDLGDMYNCDIPDKYSKLFNVNLNDLKVNVVNPDYEVDESVVGRVLNTAGLKKYSQNGKFTEELELTAFTSFSRGSGPKMLNLIIDILRNRNTNPIFTELPTQNAKIKLHAEVITQHNLVDYYTRKCDFEISDKETVLVRVTPDGRLEDCPFEDNIMASRDFTITFLHRDIQI